MRTWLALALFLPGVVWSNVVVRDGELTAVRAPGAIGVRARLAPAALPPGAKLEVFTSSAVLHQVLTAGDLSTGVRLPLPPPGAEEPDTWLEGDTVLFRLSGGGGASVTVAPLERRPGPDWASALAALHAPHIFQDTDDHQRRSDLLAAFDFDGNVNADDNWENLGLARDFPLGGKAGNQAAVYWWAAETPTHAFVGYAFFHPRDWDHLPWFQRSKREHVNDMEGIVVAVRKATGAPEMMYTVKHRDYRQYALDRHAFPMRRVRDGERTNEPKEAREEIDGVLEVRDGHPVVYIEAQGHGVCGRPFESKVTGPKYNGLKGDGVHYAPGAYALQSISTLRAMSKDSQHQGPGRAFHDEFRFQGETHGTKHSANPPWGWNDRYLNERGYPGGKGTLYSDPGGLMEWQFGVPQPFNAKIVRTTAE